MVWTLFWDMHSGGNTKEPPYDKIYIEAPKSEAITIFYNRFGHNPERVSCTCCGDDYAISTHKTLSEATKYHRVQENRINISRKTGIYPARDGIKGISLKAYEAKKDVLFIRRKDIKKGERVGQVPRQGYVWVD